MFLFEFRMLIPVGVRDLDEAHTRFAQSSREEALASEWFGRPTVDAIEGEGFLRLLLDGESLGSFALHSESQFKGLLARLDRQGGRIIFDRTLHVVSIDISEPIELQSLDRCRDLGREVFDLGLSSVSRDSSSLMDGWQEGGPEVAHAAMTERWVDGNEAGEVFVFGP